MTPSGLVLIEQAVGALQAALAAAAPDAADRPLLLRDLRYWQSRRASAQPVPVPEAPTQVAFGVRVTIRRGGATRSFRIVGEDEADPARGLLGYTAPLAVGLLGAEAGETVELEGLGGAATVLAVEA